MRGIEMIDEKKLNWNFPSSMKECLYFTNRDDAETGKAVAWVYRVDCPKCKKAKMGKPVDPKKGTAKIRSTEYVCPSCGFTESKEEHEPRCAVQIEYTCTCGHSGKAATEYKRKSWNGVPSYVFTCDGCGKKIGITKKMKAVKKKGKASSAVELDDDDDM
jgi:hypothetical protein